jgi:hypothetical protein
VLAAGESERQREDEGTLAASAEFSRKRRGREGRRGSSGPYIEVYERRYGCDELIRHRCRLGARSSCGHGAWDIRKVIEHSINLVPDYLVGRENFVLRCLSGWFIMR